MFIFVEKKRMHHFTHQRAIWHKNHPTQIDSIYYCLFKNVTMSVVWMICAISGFWVFNLENSRCVRGYCKVWKKIGGGGAPKVTDFLMHFFFRKKSKNPLRKHYNRDYNVSGSLPEKKKVSERLRKHYNCDYNVSVNPPGKIKTFPEK